MSTLLILISCEKPCGLWPDKKAMQSCPESNSYMAKPGMHDSGISRYPECSETHALRAFCCQKCKNSMTIQAMLFYIRF